MSDRIEYGPDGKGVHVVQTDGFPDGYVPPSASLEPPADIAGIRMAMYEQKWGRVEVTEFDAAEPPPTRDPGSAGPLIAFTVLVMGLLILVLVLS